MRYGPFLSLLQQTATQYQGDQRDDEDAKIWGQEPHHAPRVFQRKPAGETANLAFKCYIRAIWCYTDQKISPFSLFLNLKNNINQNKIKIINHTAYLNFLISCAKCKLCYRTAQAVSHAKWNRPQRYNITNINTLFFCKAALKKKGG